LQHGIRGNGITRGIGRNTLRRRGHLPFPSPERYFWLGIKPYRKAAGYERQLSGPDSARYFFMYFFISSGRPRAAAEMTQHLAVG
jgi:hypothetical protein